MFKSISHVDDESILYKSDFYLEDDDFSDTITLYRNVAGRTVCDLLLIATIKIYEKNKIDPLQNIILFILWLRKNYNFFDTYFNGYIEIWCEKIPEFQPYKEYVLKLLSFS